MRNAIALLVLTLSLAIVPAHAQTSAQTNLDLTASGPSLCTGSIYPIHCSTQLTLEGPSGPYHLNFAIQNSTTQSLCFIDTYCHYVTVMSFSQHIPTGAIFPDTVTFTFQGKIEAAGNGYSDGYYDDLVTGTVTYTLTYTPHSSGGGRGGHSTVWTANVTSMTGSLMYTD